MAGVGPNAEKVSEEPVKHTRKQLSETAGLKDRVEDLWVKSDDVEGLDDDALLQKIWQFRRSTPNVIPISDPDLPSKLEPKKFIKGARFPLDRLLRKLKSGIGQRANRGKEETYGFWVTGEDHLLVYNLHGSYKCSSYPSACEPVEANLEDLKEFQGVVKQICQIMEPLLPKVVTHGRLTESQEVLRQLEALIKGISDMDPFATYRAVDEILSGMKVPEVEGDAFPIIKEFKGGHLLLKVQDWTDEKDWGAFTNDHSDDLKRSDLLFLVGRTIFSNIDQLWLELSPEQRATTLYHCIKRQLFRHSRGFGLKPEENRAQIGPDGKRVGGSNTFGWCDPWKSEVYFLLENNLRNLPHVGMLDEEIFGNLQTILQDMWVIVAGNRPAGEVRAKNEGGQSSLHEEDADLEELRKTIFTDLSEFAEPGDFMDQVNTKSTRLLNKILPVQHPGDLLHPGNEDRCVDTTAPVHGVQR